MGQYGQGEPQKVLYSIPFVPVDLSGLRHFDVMRK